MEDYSQYSRDGIIGYILMYGCNGPYFVALCRIIPILGLDSFEVWLIINIEQGKSFKQAYTQTAFVGNSILVNIIMLI